MKRPQLELWQPKGTDPIYQDLSPELRRRLIDSLARLILKQVHAELNTITDSQPSTITKPHDQRSS